MLRIIASLPLLLALPLAAQPLCDAMQADFTHSATPNGVQFTDATYGNQPYAWSWDFGDGGTSTQQDPFHSYAQPGTYEVCLTAWYTPAPGSNFVCVSHHCAPVSWNGPATSVCNALDAAFTWNSTAAGAVHFTNTTTGTGQQTTWHWNFGDGTTGNDFQPVHTYSAPGTYEVCLTVVSVYSNGGNTGTLITCTNTYCANVVVQPNTNTCAWLATNFTWSGTPNGVQFTYAPVLAGAVYTYLWDFGDGHTSTQQSPFHTYATGGNYEACLTVTAHTNNSTITCTATTCQPVSWNGPATSVCNALDAAFTWNSTAAGAVHFTNTTMDTGQQTTWHWNFGDGTTSNDAQPVHTYSAPGTYEVCLTVVSVHFNGTTSAPAITCTDTYCANVVVQPNTNTCAWLAANFTWSGTPNGVQFTYAPVLAGAVYTYLWDFGDGHTSTQQSPFHTYAAGGNYEACLTVTAHTNNSTIACTATTCQLVSWNGPATNVCNALDAAFTWNGTVSGTNAAVVFTNTTTGTGQQTTWHWDFGDGTTSTAEHPAHVFPGPGTYEVCLTVVSIHTNGSTTGTLITCTDTYCAHVVVQPSTNTCAWLTANFTWQGTPNGVQFTYVPPVAGAVYSYLWTFNNGVISDQQNPFIPINASFSGEVCLTVTAQSGNSTVPCTATSCQTVHWVVPAPCAGHEVSIHTGPATTAAVNVFWATVTPWTNSITWDFGDGTTATGPQVTHTFPAPGTYTVCVTATWPATNTPALCSATACTTVTVGGNAGVCDPSFALEVNAQPASPAGGYVLHAITNIPAGGIHWTYGNGVVVQGPTLQVAPFTNTAVELCVNAWYLPTASNDTCWTSICGDLQTFLLGVGIEERSGDARLMAYPNPASDVMTIAWTGSEGLVTLRLFAMDGRLEREVSTSQWPYGMDVAGLPQGVHVLRMEHAGGSLSMRVMVR